MITHKVMAYNSDDIGECVFVGDVTSCQTFVDECDAEYHDRGLYLMIEAK